MESLKMFQKYHDFNFFRLNLKPKDEPVTCGMPYNFTVLKSPVTSHIGKMIINPNW